LFCILYCVMNECNSDGVVISLDDDFVDAILPSDSLFIAGSRDVKRLSVYRLSFIFLVLVFEFQKPIIVSNLALSS